MNQTDYWKAATKRALMVIVPIPVGFVAIVCLFEVFGEDFWGGLKGKLFHYYSAIGLVGVPYGFSWSISTVELVLGLPYSWLLLIGWALIGNEVKICQSSSKIVNTIQKCCLIFVLPVLSVPLTLVLLRIFWSNIVSSFVNLVDRIHFENMFWRDWTLRFFLFAFPCGLVTLALQHVVVKIRDSLESSDAQRQA